MAKDSGFNAAFAAARKKLGAGKTFTYNGKSYSTNRADDKPAAKPATGMTSSPKPQARPSWMGTAGGAQRNAMATPEGTRSDASRVSVTPPAKPATTGMTSSPRPMPKPAAAGMTSSPRPMPKPTPKASSAAGVQPQRPVSKTPGAKPAGEGKKLTYESRAMLARTTKGK